MHHRTTQHSSFFPNRINGPEEAKRLAHVLYMEWELPGLADDHAASQLVAELCEAERGRLVGSRGVHASLLLQDGPRLVVIMVLDSRAMLEAYASWTRLRVTRRLGVRPSRQETFDLLGAAEGGAPLALGAEISYDASYSLSKKKEEASAAAAARARGGGHGGDLASG
ncbi:MAG: hypothetical protein QOJ55_2380 [Solirubrobacteraceae bacterium]|nr:hypothetical protein [Solirubrobacteraceae bacterium]